MKAITSVLDTGTRRHGYDLELMLLKKPNEQLKLLDEYKKH